MPLALAINSSILYIKINTVDNMVKEGKGMSEMLSGKLETLQVELENGTPQIPDFRWVFKLEPSSIKRIDM